MPFHSKKKIRMRSRLNPELNATNTSYGGAAFMIKVLQGVSMSIYETQTDTIGRGDVKVSTDGAVQGRESAASHPHTGLWVLASSRLVFSAPSQRCKVS